MELEEGKIYLLKVIASGAIWLFKKHCGQFSDRIAGCSKAICLDDMYMSHKEAYVCDNSEIGYIKDVNNNHIAKWNRVFNDNIELR